jgi:hypothetical protein
MWCILGSILPCDCLQVFRREVGGSRIPSGAISRLWRASRGELKARNGVVEFPGQIWVTSM